MRITRDNLLRIAWGRSQKSQISRDTQAVKWEGRIASNQTRIIGDQARAVTCRIRITRTISLKAIQVRIIHKRTHRLSSIILPRLMRN